jgi:predicted secreted protein
MYLQECREEQALARMSQLLGGGVLLRATCFRASQQPLVFCVER